MQRAFSKMKLVKRYKSWEKKKLGSPELRRAIVNQRVVRLRKLKREHLEARGVMNSARKVLISKGIFKH
jgi:hypothetical protein